MSMKDKRDMYMKFDVSWRLFLSESVIYFLLLFFNFFEDHSKECPLIKAK